MKIAINISTLKNGHKGRGIGFYTENLLAQLKKREDIEVIEFGDLSELKNADLVHYPTFDLFLPTLPLRKKFPTVVTIHDVIPLRFSNHYPPGIKGSVYNLIQKYSLKSADAVITDSMNSKKDISNYLGYALDKIYPVYLAASDKFKKISDTKKIAEVKKKYELPDEFVVFVGNVNWNKNLLHMTEAAILTSTEFVLIGKAFAEKENLHHPELASYKEFINKYLNNPLIHTYGFIPSEDLVTILNLAQGLLFASFYEGFGMPILEAQACGLPVITGNTSSMPEVAGSSAILVNPESVEEIAQAIKTVMLDRKRRKQLIDDGFENIKRFSWQKTADETIQAYKQVLNRN